MKKSGDDAQVVDCNSLFRHVKVGVTNAQNKIFFEKPFDFRGGFDGGAMIELAKNEYEAAQLVLFSERSEIVTISVNDLRLSDSDTAIVSADNLDINVVAHVNLVEAKVPKESRPGWYPDPLLNNQPVELRPKRPQAFLITVYAPPATVSGEYWSEIIVATSAGHELRIPLRVEVWDFELPKVSRFKTTVLADWTTPDDMWPKAMGYPKPTDEVRKQHMLRLADLGFHNRLPPTAYLANGLMSWNWKGEGDTRLGYPTHDKGKFNAGRTLELIRYMLDKGANHFFVGLTSDIYEIEKLTAFREAALRRYLKDYREFLQAHDLLGMAYIYGVDEPWGDAVERARRTYTFVRDNGGQGIRFLQNTNQDNGRIIGELLGFFDALDINLGWYEKIELHDYRKSHPKAMAEVWWNVNFWPDSHPNLFLEYPLTDARIIGPMSYKFDIQGFEYWDVLAKTGIDNYYPLPPDELYVDWQVDKNSLDGTLVYPGENYEIYSSLRYESLRDGFEDLEYLYLLESLDPDHPLLDVPIVTSIDDFATDPEVILAFRREVAKAIIKNQSSKALTTEDTEITEKRLLNFQKLN
ncbi:MAG TPA: glycoside hydrolase domain-containing protein [Gammaproteobacteria bacterium]